MKLFTILRCDLTQRILRSGWSKKYFLANLICPSTETLINDANRKATAIPLPRVSHIFYHQASVELECAENSLRTVLWNVPFSDEVILYDKGGTLQPRHFDLLRDYAWRSWSVHRELSPEMASYTYGMNHSFPMTQGEIVCIWRSDYIYPRGVYARYLKHIEEYEIVFPYQVYIGSTQMDGAFVRENWEKIEAYDDGFWAKNSELVYSLYESEDPVHFAIRRKTWEKLGGLNHQLWGYGWQFADFAARIRKHIPKRKIKYFDHDKAIHQNHASSLMVRTNGFDEKKQTEDREGRDKFARFLGGNKQLECYMYRWNQRLKPIPPEERQ